jgi:hypothetical protein
VICDKNAADGQINTLVGVNTIFPNRPALTRLGDFRAERHTAKPTTGVFVGRLHWRFYDKRSVHVIDGVIDVTDNDFVRFDWCNVVSKLPALNNQPGYLLFHADSLRLNTAKNIWLGEGTTPANNATYLNCALAAAGCDAATWRTISSGTDVFDTSVLTARGTAGNLGFERRIWLYGQAYLIQGNWESQGFIPIVTAPVWDTVVRNGYPAIERLRRGVSFTDNESADRYQNIIMRYFLDPGLARFNNMVFWFNTNAARLVPLETFDSEQVYQFSFTTNLPDELNIIASTPANPAFPGMIHESTETLGPNSPVSNPLVINTGLVHFYIPQLKSTVSWASSGISFNLLGLGAGGNAAQVQTEMSTAAGDLTGPF